MQIISIDLYYPLFAIFMLVLALVLIPKDEFKTLFWYGLVWGYLVGTIVVLIFGVWLNWIDFKLAGPYYIFHSSLWLGFAWILSMMLYLYFLPTSKLWYVFPLYVFIFSGSSAAIDQVFHQAGLLAYNFWSPYFRLILAIAWFWSAKIHYQATRQTFQTGRK